MKLHIIILLSILPGIYANSAPKEKGKTLNSRDQFQDWVITGNVTLNSNYTVTSGSNLTINSGATLTIPNGITLTNNSGFLSGIWNQGTIIIENGGTLTNTGEFHNDFFSSINVDGTLNNSGSVYDCRLNISGVINNNNLMIIAGTNALPSRVNSTGVFNNLSNGYLLVVYLEIDAGGKLTNAGKLYGNINFLGGGTIINSGIVAPGNSPGVFDINGNYTATSTAIHNFEVAGTTSTNYDRLLVSGNLHLDGTLNVSLINGFTPSSTHDLTIMTGNVTGTFSTANLPPPYTLVYNSNSVVLQYQSTLPVTFNSINALKLSNGKKINWSVSTEQNVLEYEVEGSNDGKRFFKIGSVKASGQNSYSYLDVDLSNTFYRIRSVDVDASIKYSSIVRITGDHSSVLFNVFPSLVINEAILQHPTTSANSKITISSIDGKFISAIVPATSVQQTKINCSGLKAGIYILSYRDGNELQTLKVIKQ